MWDKETLIVPIIIGALGSIPNDLECNLKKLGISYHVGTLQKSVLLRTANNLRKVLLNNKDKKIVGKWEKTKRGGSKKEKKRGVSS